MAGAGAGASVSGGEGEGGGTKGCCKDQSARIYKVRLDGHKMSKRTSYLRPDCERNQTCPHVSGPNHLEVE